MTLIAIQTIASADALYLAGLPSSPTMIPSVGAIGTETSVDRAVIAASVPQPERRTAARRALPPIDLTPRPARTLALNPGGTHDHSHLSRHTARPRPLQR